LCTRKDVEIAYVCDVDKTRMADAAKTVEGKSKKAPKAVGDMRTILDDKAIDAVFIATPDHWHAPAAILALDAGKHVYVEKPCCHNIREGPWSSRPLPGKCLQVGTQTRLTPTAMEAMQNSAKRDRRNLAAKAWNSETRHDRQIEADPAAGAPRLRHPMARRRWSSIGPTFCTASSAGGRPRAGDIGNDGVHDIDVGLGLG
jgi:hypothetical protein